MKQNIIAAAVTAFTLFPNAETVWVAKDEQAFLHKNHAIGYDKDSIEVKRSDVSEDLEKGKAKNVSTIKEKINDVLATSLAKAGQTAAPEGANAVIAKVKDLTTVEDLEALRANDNRKSVHAAIDKRIAELKNPA